MKLELLHCADTGLQGAHGTGASTLVTLTKALLAHCIKMLCLSLKSMCGFGMSYPAQLTDAVLQRRCVITVYPMYDILV